MVGCLEANIYIKRGNDQTIGLTNHNIKKTSILHQLIILNEVMTYFLNRVSN